MSGRAEHWPVVGTGPAGSGVRAQEMRIAVWKAPKQPFFGTLLKVGQL